MAKRQVVLHRLSGGVVIKVLVAIATASTAGKRRANEKSFF